MVEEGTVVRDHENSAIIIFEVSFQPLYRLNIKMVCWLIEKKEAWFSEQYLGKLHTHLPAVAELAHHARHILMIKAETYKYPFGLTFSRMSAHKNETFVEVTQLITQSLVCRTFIIFTVRQLVLNLNNLIFKTMHFLKRRHCLFKHRLGRINVHLLREVADSDIIRHHYRAMRWLLQASNHPYQSSFSGTIFPDEAYPIFLTYQEVNICKQVLPREVHAKVLY